MRRSSMFLCLLLGAIMLSMESARASPVDARVRAQLEAKVISSMSLKDLERLVENDERVRNAPKKSKIILMPKGSDDPEADAIVIQRKPKKYLKPAEPELRIESSAEFEDRSFRRPLIQSRYGFDGESESTRRSSFEPEFYLGGFESSATQFEPSWFQIPDLESAGSEPVQKFYESLVASVMSPHGSETFARDPLAILEAVASEDVPAYRPRFDYDSYSKDPTEVKMRGKTYWKDAPERREEKIDENGCRTVVKKIMDPEDEKKSHNGKPKGVMITKECEYPNIEGPDAKIPEIRPVFRPDTSRVDSSASFEKYDTEPETYKSSRPVELEFRKPEAKDPLAPDYIDRMLESHFKSFPSFSNPLTSFRGYQERFNLRKPEAFKDIKPKVGIQSYEYSHPESGFDEDEPRAPVEDTKRDSPKVIEHHYHYDYPESVPRKADPENYAIKEKDVKKDTKSSEGKEPKMMKKSFAYYRKDNPKEDPNDHQYAEEYAQGNFRSFSSDYDSERDGPKKS
ncbi:uncharacterized protein LOC129217187 [Uloborus diversus]|uniref:uncharacterized protein LOC129217187 n=1 Tax=Uloborus diversus TaxID=327109 RepID=UPI002409C123|nr:uncharacterized protein LOC129217187 [Uloborus diversus]